MKEKYNLENNNDGTDIDNDYTVSNLLYVFEGDDWKYHFDLHQNAVKEKLSFTNEMTMGDGGKYRGYLK